MNQSDKFQLHYLYIYKHNLFISLIECSDNYGLYCKIDFFY